MSMNALRVLKVHTQLIKIWKDRLFSTVKSGHSRQLKPQKLANYRKQNLKSGKSPGLGLIYNPKSEIWIY